MVGMNIRQQQMNNSNNMFNKPSKNVNMGIREEIINNLKNNITEELEENENGKIEPFYGSVNYSLY